MILPFLLELQLFVDLLSFAKYEQHFHEEIVHVDMLELNSLHEVERNFVHL